MADVATIAILSHRAVIAAHALSEQLQHALNNCIVIEQAKGILAERADLDMNDAFTWLRNYARSHNLFLVDVAQSVTDGRVAPDPPRRDLVEPLQSPQPLVVHGAADAPQVVVASEGFHSSGSPVDDRQ